MLQFKWFTDAKVQINIEKTNFRAAFSPIARFGIKTLVFPEGILALPSFDPQAHNSSGSDSLNVTDSPDPNVSDFPPTAGQYPMCLLNDGRPKRCLPSADKPDAILFFSYLPYL